MSSVASPVTRSRRGTPFLAALLGLVTLGGRAFADSKPVETAKTDGKPATTTPAPTVDLDAEALAFAKSVQDSLIKSVAAVRESSVSVFNQKLVGEGNDPAK